MKQNKNPHKIETPSFEQSLKRLEDIVESLESGSVPLEEALDLYEEGVKISKGCLDKLSRAEVRLKHLMKDIDGKLSLADETIEEE